MFQHVQNLLGDIVIKKIMFFFYNPLDKELIHWLILIYKLFYSENVRPFSPHVIFINYLFSLI